MEHIVLQLKKYGFTDYEAKVFNALADIGVGTATEVSQTSGVPRARIYDILGNLSRKGWIQKVPSSPLKYSIEDYPVIEKKLRSIEKDMNNARNSVLQQVIATKQTDLPDEDKPVDIFPSTKETVSELTVTINNAKDKIMFFHPFDALMHEILDLLKNAARRGVKVLVYTVPGKYLKLKKDFTIRNTDEPCSYANMLIDYTVYYNFVHKRGGVLGTKVSYKKCTHCLSGWLKREWEN